MTTLLVVSCLWVLAATAIAMLPMRYQIVPGIALLLAAPVLVYLIAVTVSLWAAIIAALAVLSMFRKPLGYFSKRVVGGFPEVPK